MNDEINGEQPSFVCNNCGGQLEFETTDEITECPYCGTRYLVASLLNESETVRIERIKNKTEYARIQNESRKVEAQREWNIEVSKRADADSFKNGALSKIILVFGVLAIISTIIALCNGKIVAALISAAIVMLFMLSWLLGMQIIREKRRYFHVFLSIIAFALIIPFIGFLFDFSLTSCIPQLYFSTLADPKPSHSTSYEEPAAPDANAENFLWSNVEMKDMLPKVDDPYGEIIYNREDIFIVYLFHKTENDFYQYRDECTELGYTVDYEKSESYYRAYNSDGYLLKLSYDKETEKMDISLEDPIEMKPLKWPSLGLATEIPVPKSDVGNITLNDSSFFDVYIGNTSIEDFAEYVTECQNAGFYIDYYQSDTYYSAEDAEGCHISVEYLGFNMMYVDIWNLKK